MDAQPTRWNARVLDTVRAAKLHLFILTSHTINDRHTLCKSVCAVLKSSLKTTFIQQTPSIAKSHREALAHALLLSRSITNHLRRRLSTFQKTGIVRYNPGLVRKRCTSKYPNSNPIKLVTTACDHELKPTGCQPRSSEAEHRKTDSECLELWPPLHLASTTLPVEPSLDEQHSNLISFLPFSLLPTIDPPPHFRQFGDILIPALDTSTLPNPQRTKWTASSTQRKDRNQTISSVPTPPPHVLS